MRTNKPKGVFLRRGVWYWRRVRAGREQWRSLGTDREKAFRQARKLSEQFDATSDPFRQSIRLRAAVDKWLSVSVSRRRRSAMDRQTIETRMRQHVLPYFDNPRLERVTVAQVEGLALALKTAKQLKHERKTLSVQTQRHVLAAFRQFMLWCVRSGYIDRAPLPEALLPAVDARPPDKLTDIERAAVSRVPGPAGFVVRLGLATGLRWGEMARARLSDIEGQWLVVPRTKAGKFRRVPLTTPEGEALLAEIKTMRGQIMRRPGQRLITYSARSAQAVAKAVRRSSNVHRFHVHQLRHTFACLWIDRGGSLETLRDVMGHSTVRTTERYGRASDATVMRDAARGRYVANYVAGGSDRDRKS
ncbi:MAG: site-specific integrase [Candidatus Eisenbacteria bacterium]|nr:site-specific integrase [Candidatus Eisenbacteria bacterium]